MKTRIPGEDIMDKTEARRLVAAHLSGRLRIPRERLKTALIEVGADARFRQFLADQLGYPADSEDTCASFRQDMALYIETPPDRRKTDFPDFHRHLKDCPDCAREFRQAESAWGSGADRRHGAGFDPVEAFISEERPAPPDGRARMELLTDTEPDRGRQRTQMWDLRVQELSIALNIMIRYGEEPEPEVCLHAPNLQLVAPGRIIDTRIIDLSDHSQYTSVDLQEPVYARLPEGDYRISIDIPLPGGTGRWQVPLDLCCQK